MARFHKVDAVATVQARDTGKFKDYRSYVTVTGCVKLFGADFSNQCAAVIKKHGNRCYRCGEWRPRYQLEVDHDKPRGQGGCDCEHNLRPLCQPSPNAGCHRGKGGKHA